VGEGPAQLLGREKAARREPATPPSPACGGGMGRGPQTPFASPLEGEAGSPKANREGGMTKTAHRPVSRLHRGRAKALRREMTNAERFLWFILREHRLAGLSFRRQVPIGPFIADFVCQQHRLIIEIDGGQHAADPLRDQPRDEWLRSKGYRVLRFRNMEVLRNRPAVLQTIVDAVASKLPPSLPSPASGGGNPSKWRVARYTAWNAESSR
jgi:very-short-patch-repair endonuclease